MNRYRSYTWTLNNYTVTDISVLEKISVRYIVFGYETAPSTGTPHLQGYFTFENKKSIKQLVKLTKTDRINYLPSKGSAEQNRLYCLGLVPDKEINEKYHERGDMPIQGKRNDITKIKEKIKKGVKLEVILDEVENLNFQVIRCAQILKGIFSKKRTTKPIVLWIYGSTGSGKTRLIHDTFLDIYIKDESKWWDGYDTNKVILVDDYRLNFFKFSELLRFLDRYAYRREYKGGALQINSPWIIFTSPKSPFEMWNHRCKEDLGQLVRRIDFVLNMDLRNHILQSVRVESVNY